MKSDRTTRHPSHERVLAVEEGEVVCPRRGLVTLERCWACPDYAGFSPGHIEGVICRADPLDAALDIRPVR